MNRTVDTLLLANVSRRRFLQGLAAGSALVVAARWDLAAAALIASEAGAVITDLNGDAFAYNTAGTSNDGVICAGPMLYALLQERVNKDKAAKKSAAFQSQLETKMSDRNQAKNKPEQLLHLVLGGELVDPMRTEFIDLKKVEFIGAYPNYEKADNIAINDGDLASTRNYYQDEEDSEDTPRMYNSPQTPKQIGESGLIIQQYDTKKRNTLILHENASNLHPKIGREN